MFSLTKSAREFRTEQESDGLLEIETITSSKKLWHSGSKLHTRNGQTVSFHTWLLKITRFAWYCNYSKCNSGRSYPVTRSSVYYNSTTIPKLRYLSSNLQSFAFEILTYLSRSLFFYLCNLYINSKMPYTNNIIPKLDHLWSQVILIQKRITVLQPLINPSHSEVLSCAHSFSPQEVLPSTGNWLGDKRIPI